MMGGADLFVRDRIKDFRAAAIELIERAPPFTLGTLVAEQKRLAVRLSRYGDCRDAPQIWREAGLADGDRIADMSEEAFLALPRLKEAANDAR